MPRWYGSPIDARPCSIRSLTAATRMSALLRLQSRCASRAEIATSLLNRSVVALYSINALPERAPDAADMNDALASNQDISRKEPIEVGWLLFSSEPNAPMEAAAEARGEVQTRLSNLFPEYNWVMPEARHVLHELDDAISPVQILERAERERDRHGWDFAIAITDLDLVSHLKSYAMGAPSRALGVCVLSLARLDERGAAARTSERSASTIRRRITALALHLFGDLNGIEHATNPVNYMHPPDSVDDLDRMVEYGAGCTEQLRVALRAVADPRLEESAAPSPGAARFYARAVWQNRRAVVEAVLQARPWQFPFRLSKLTTAAASMMTVLLITAEAWELGMTQSPLVVTLLSLLALVLTSWFVVRRQRILTRRHHRGLTEQRALSEVSVVLSVWFGMLTTYLLLFLSTLAFSLILFQPSVVHEWTAALQGGPTVQHYLILAGFVAMLGLSIGALGASFEANEYFRHIALIDEET